MKLRAIENLHAAGIDVCLVVTIVNTVNNDQVGPIVKFALENCDKISFVSFQPVSFTGRDEDISDAERHAKRYTLSHLAEDLKRQTGVTEPLRDWYPLSASSVMSDVTDLMLGPAADWGSLKCGCHPDCGIGTAFMVSKKTKQWAPLASFVNVDRMLEDAKVISDAARGPLLTKIQTAMSLLRNYNPLKAPKGFRLIDLIRKYDKQSGGQLGGKLNGDLTDRRQDEWLLMFVAGMWFQDLWTYDFRRTEMCIIPYATQMGEISFCAYNTGVGWRQIVENMHYNASVADWYKEHGKHAVYANPKKAVPLPPGSKLLTLKIPRNGELVDWAPRTGASSKQIRSRHSPAGHVGRTSLARTKTHVGELPAGALRESQIENRIPFYNRRPAESKPGAHPAISCGERAQPLKRLMKLISQRQSTIAQDAPVARPRTGKRRSRSAFSTPASLTTCPARTRTLHRPRATRSQSPPNTAATIHSASG